MPISAKSPITDGISGFPEPFWAAPGAALYLGDVRARLRAMPSRSVHTAVTSPPYYRQREYLEENHPDSAAEIGTEAAPEQYVAAIVTVFRELWRVMRDDAVAWLNLGDTFDRGQLLVPARVALALIADGWKLVQDIIWYSPNKMPESVTNRCTKSHEHIFLLAKGDDYYYDSVAIEEDGVCPPGTRGGKASVERYNAKGVNSRPPETKVYDGKKNKRDVWTVSTVPYPGAHRAVFSPQLITPCILAGTSEHGVCASCGKPWERVVSTEKLTRDRPNDVTGKNGVPNTVAGVSKTTVGWQKLCGCLTDEVVPAVVLDPFVGSGTTVATSIELGRHGVGIDLSEVYLRENAIPRIEAAMRGERVQRKPTVAVKAGTPPAPKTLR